MRCAIVGWRKAAPPDLHTGHLQAPPQVAGANWTFACSDIGPLPSTAVHLEPVADEPANQVVHTWLLGLRIPHTLAANVPYTGSLIATSGTTTTVIAVTGTRVAETTFVVEPQKIDIRIESPQSRQRITIRNTGSASLSNIAVAPYELRDTTLRSSFGGGSPTLLTTTGDTPQGATIPPREERSFDIYAPTPRFAGTYTGTVRITANDTSQALGMSVTTRGPYGDTSLPFIIFALTVIGGFGTSALLDRWLLGGGQTRALLQIALLEIADELSRIARDEQLLPWVQERAKPLSSFGRRYESSFLFFSSRSRVLRPFPRCRRQDGAGLRIRDRAGVVAHDVRRVHDVDEAAVADSLSSGRIPLLRWLAARDSLRQHEAGHARSRAVEPSLC